MLCAHAALNSSSPSCLLSASPPLFNIDKLLLSPACVLEDLPPHVLSESIQALKILSISMENGTSSRYPLTGTNSEWHPRCLSARVRHLEEGRNVFFPDQWIIGVCGNDGSLDSCLSAGLTRSLTLEAKSEAADLDEWWMVCTHRQTGFSKGRLASCGRQWSTYICLQ